VESVTDNTPLIAIVGQTASGKSALALHLAQQFNGEIIAADSRTVYRGMDIGTAKPSAEDQAKVPHHVIDVVDPSDPFTVAEFQRLARQAIADITARGKIPFLVGGSGLYVDGVLYDFRFRAPADTAERRRLERLSVEELQSLIDEEGIELPSNKQNPRHLIRTIESNGQIATKGPLRDNTLIVGLAKESQDIRANIEARVDAMLAAGFVDEVRVLSERYGWGAPALQAPGYRAFRRYLSGESSLDQAKQEFIQRDYQYAKRQKTWFKRNPDIHWISKSEEAVDLITTFLNK